MRLSPFATDTLRDYSSAPDVPNNRGPLRRRTAAVALTAALTAACAPISPPVTQETTAPWPVPTAPAPPAPTEAPAPAEAPLTELLGVGSSDQDKSTHYIGNMEIMLKAIGCDEIAPIILNGVYDASEAPALSSFKRSKGVPDGGNYGPQTYPELNAAYKRVPQDTHCGWNGRDIEPAPAPPAPRRQAPDSPADQAPVYQAQYRDVAPITPVSLPVV